jgi:acetoacetate decarboxylase
MGIVKTADEIAAKSVETFDFFDSKMLTVLYETKAETVERLLPPPLKPVKRPIAFAYLANFPRTNWGMPYMEAALFLGAEYEGIEGGYCLAMPVTSDMAMAGGREVFGFPKKIGQIDLTRSGDQIHGWVERHGVRLMELQAKLSGRFNTTDAQGIIGDVFRPGTNTVYYNFKHFPAPDWSTFDYAPRLVRGEVKRQLKSQEIGEAEIALRSSGHDPWSEVEVARVLGAIYTVADSSMLKAQVVAEVGPVTFVPHSFLKGD